MFMFVSEGVTCGTFPSAVEGQAKCDEVEWGDGDPGGRRDEAPVRGKGREDACGSIDA